MRIAIATDGEYVSPHFGRCPSYTLIDVENKKTINRLEVSNPGHSPGAIPRFLHEKGVKKIICGGVGVRAQGFFAELGIETVVGVEGRIEDVIHRLEQETLQGGESLCAPGAGRGYGVEKAVCDHSDEE